MLVLPCYSACLTSSRLWACGQTFACLLDCRSRCCMKSKGRATTACQPVQLTTVLKAASCGTQQGLTLANESGCSSNEHRERGVMRRQHSADIATHQKLGITCSAPALSLESQMAACPTVPPCSQGRFYWRQNSGLMKSAECNTS